MTDLDLTDLDLTDLDLTDLDLTFEAPKAPKARKPKFTEMVPKWNGYHLATPPRSPKTPPRGGMIDEVFKENASHRAGEWAEARKFAEQADRRRLGAEYRAKLLINLLQEI